METSRHHHHTHLLNDSKEVFGQQLLEIVLALHVNLGVNVLGLSLVEPLSVVQDEQ